MKKGTDLTDGTEVSFAELMKLAGECGISKNKVQVNQLQTDSGYTNIQLESTKIKDQSNIVTTATKVNDGAITQYPYAMNPWHNNCCQDPWPVLSVGTGAG